MHITHFKKLPQYIKTRLGDAICPNNGVLKCKVEVISYGGIKKNLANLRKRSVRAKTLSMFSTWLMKKSN